MKLLEILQSRRSIRKYTGENVKDSDLRKILQAGLLSVSSRGKRPWRFIVVKDPEALQKLSECRQGSAKMLEHAYCAIVVIGDAELADVWVEDCAIAMANMHLMADSLGVGSCWIQGRLREKTEKVTTEDAVREIVEFPENFHLEAILSLGMPQKHPEGYSLDALDYEKVFAEKFGQRMDI